jgi:hypothetical protein
MEEKTAKRLFLEARHAMLQALLRLIEVQSKVKPDKLSPKDSKQYIDSLQANADASKAMGQTIAAAPSDEDLYAQMAASSDRMREEIERHIKIVETLLSRQRA